jgi:hypothetical protein
MVGIKLFKMKGEQNDKGTTTHGRIQGVPDVCTVSLHVCSTLKKGCVKKILDLWQFTEKQLNNT